MVHFALKQLYLSAEEDRITILFPSVRRGNSVGTGKHPAEWREWVGAVDISHLEPSFKRRVQTELRSRLGNRGVRVSVFFLQKLRFSALCWPNQQKFGTLWTWPKVIKPPKNFPNLSTDGQENTTFSLKVTNPHASIPSSAHSRVTQQRLPHETGEMGSMKLHFLISVDARCDLFLNAIV